MFKEDISFDTLILNLLLLLIFILFYSYLLLILLSTILLILFDIFFVLSSEDDIWTTGFRLVSHEQDISYVSPIKLVCSRWRKCLNESINETIISKAESLNWYAIYYSPFLLLFFFCFTFFY